MKMRFASFLKAFAVCAAMTPLAACTWHHVEPEVCFETEVRPVLTSYCSTVGCHNPQDRVEDYDFTTYQGIMAAVRPGRPGGSKLYEAMTAGGDDHMPPAGQPQPTADQIATIQAWIKSGADNTQNCGGTTCDTTQAVSYSGDLQPMFQSNCNGCHGGGSPSGGLDFTTFATVRDNAVNGRIQGAINQASGYAPMPPNSAPLAGCYPLLLDKWVAAGAPNN